MFITIGKSTINVNSIAHIEERPAPISEIEMHNRMCQIYFGPHHTLSLYDEDADLLMAALPQRVTPWHPRTGG